MGRYKFGGLGQKPPLGSTIDWGNPMCNGLKLFTPCNEGAGGLLRNIVNQDVFEYDTVLIGTPASDYLWTNSRGGLSVQNNSAAATDQHQFNLASGSFYNAIVGITFGGLAVYAVDSGGNYPRLLGKYNFLDNTKWDWILLANNNGTDWYASTQSSAGTSNITNVASVGGVEFIMCTFDGTSFKFYQNGVLKATNSLSGTAMNHGDHIYISNHNVGFASPGRWIQPIYATYMWNRCLGADEIRDLYASPYQLVKTRTVFALQGTVVVPLTLSTADTVNNYADSASNSGYARAAAGFFDALSLLDALAYTGGAPDYQVSFSDAIHLQDGLTVPVQNLIGIFSDSINLLADAVAKLIGIPIQAFDSQQFNWADALNAQLRTPQGITASDSINNLLDSASVNSLVFVLQIIKSDTINFLNDALRINRILEFAFGDNYVLSDATVLRLRHFSALADSINNLLDSAAKEVKDRPSFGDGFSFGDSAVLGMFVQQSVSKGDSANFLADAVVVTATGSYTPASLVDRIRRYLNDMNNT